MDKEVPVKFGKLSRSGVWIQSLYPDPDHILLGGRMRSPTALIIEFMTLQWWVALLFHFPDVYDNVSNSCDGVGKHSYII